jgi:hypothetical protein
MVTCARRISSQFDLYRFREEKQTVRIPYQGDEENLVGIGGRAKV